MSELVHDLLDLAKVEAGRVTLRPTPFTVPDLFGALRGLMRPVQTNDAVALVFDAPDGLPPLLTDEAKVSQILRNYISNALKLRRAGRDRPDVVFLDLRMPGMPGAEVLARLKRDPATAAIPVVIATSLAVSEAEVERLSAHVVSVLGKNRIGAEDGDLEVRRVLRAAGILS